MFVLPVLIVATVLALLPVLGGTPLDWTKQPSFASTAIFFALFMVLPVGAPVADRSQPTRLT